MRNEISKTGYTLHTTIKGFQNLAQANTNQIAAASNNYDAPEGFVPGAKHGANDGYSYGSEIITRDGKVYKCADPTPGKAVWLEIANTITESSYDATIEAVEKSAPKETETEEVEVPEEDTKGGDTASEPKIDASAKIPLDDLDGLPYLTYLKDKNDLHTLGDVVGHIEAGTLADLPYLNEKRAAQIVEYIDGLK